MKLVLRRLAVALAMALLAGLAFQVLTWPQVGSLKKLNPDSTAFIDAYKREQRRKEKPVQLSWKPVPYGSIATTLKHAVVVAEDIDFFSHHGFAWDEVKKAMDEAKERDQGMRGASTLTQQLVKNLWLSPSRNPWRKMKEALLTRQLERTLEKRRILELYLNVVEFGPGVYGAEAASRRYFGKSAAGLSESEAAALAASLSRPSSWHPGIKSRGYERHIQRILGRMSRALWVRKEL